MRYPKGSKLVPKAWRKMYPNGYPYEKGTKICGVIQPYEGIASHAICIIDNPHIGRPHWGPDSTGTYKQWGLAGKESTTEGRG